MTGGSAADRRGSATAAPGGHTREHERIRAVYGYYESSEAERRKRDTSRPGVGLNARARWEGLRRALTACDLPAGACVLDVGCGGGHDLLWIADLLAPLGPRLHGVDLLTDRVERARRRVPVATFHACGAEQLPYENGEFDVVIVSTVFSSILDDRSVQEVAREITRVLACRGVILCYDMRYPNPRNPHTRAIGLRELRWLFPGAELRAVPVTLLPPLARGLGALAHPAYRALYAIPMLRSHYLTEIRSGRLVASPERGSGIHEKSRSPRNSR